MKIGAILILYNYDLATRNPRLLSELALQVDEVCVVDNSQKSHVAFFNLSNITYIPLMHNRGIAFAQNIGLRYFLAKDYDYVIFSDQDSLITDHLVRRLLESKTELEEQGLSVGGISPRAYRKGMHVPYPLHTDALKTFVVPSGHTYTSVTYLMSSMSIFQLKLFQTVGLLDEALFIDGVDNEWCWRASHRLKINFYVAEYLQFEHQLGLGTKSLMGKKISITPAYRMYYQYRNYLWLIRRPYVPYKWKFYNGWKYLCKIPYYTIIGPNRIACLRNIFKGVYDGLFRCHSKAHAEKI